MASAESGDMSIKNKNTRSINNFTSVVNFRIICHVQNFWKIFQGLQFA